MKKSVKLTKVVTQSIVLIIENDKDDHDEFADKAWEEFNKLDLEYETKYTTEVGED